MTTEQHFITVQHVRGASFTVIVDDGRSATTHEVSVWPSDVERYAPGAAPEELLEASFRFLLSRETKESILRRFDLGVIEQYFPDYRSQIGAFIRHSPEP